MSRWKVVVGASSFARVSDKPLRLLREHDVEVTLNPYGRKLSRNETIDFLRGADGILAGLEPLDRDVLSTCRGKLKALARIGIGMDNVDIQAAQEFGIRVSNTPDGPTQAVAELTVTALLALCRQLIPSSAALHARQWKKLMGVSVMGMKVLLIGYGRIGQAVASSLRNLGAEILVWDPARPDISVSSMEEGLRQAGAVSLHASGTQQILGKQELALLPDGAFLLNSARGGLVDEEALYQELISGRLGGCWLDAFSAEPYTGPLCDCPGALLTPHVSTYTTRCRETMETEAVHNLLRDIHAL